MNRSLNWDVILLVLGASLGCLIWWQAEVHFTLRQAQEGLQAQAAEALLLKKLRTQYQLQAAAEEAARLCARIERLKERQERMSMLHGSGVKELNEGLWPKVGLATPSDTLHSVIWAATHGEVDELAAMLAFAPESRAAAETLFASLPKENRTQFPTVEKLIATMISGRMPVRLVQAEAIEQRFESADLVAVKFQLKRSISETREPIYEVTFRFQRNGSDWRLLVPQSAIAEFKRSLATLYSGLYKTVATKRTER